VLRREVKLKMNLDSDTAKGSGPQAKLKKVQASIQGEQVRVTSPDMMCCRTRSPC
jgi:hypothetical protein